METKQISNYLVKLGGFKSDPDKSRSAMVTKPAPEMQVSVKNSVEGVRRFQVVESEANAGLALSKWMSVTGNQSIDPGRGAKMSQRRVTSPRPSTTGRGGHWWARAWVEAMEVSRSKMELPWPHEMSGT